MILQKFRSFNLEEQAKQQTNMGEHISIQDVIDKSYQITQNEGVLDLVLQNSFSFKRLNSSQLYENLLDHSKPHQSSLLESFKQDIQNTPTLGIVCLFLGPLFVGMMGPLMNYIGTQNPFTQLVWMNQPALVGLLLIEFFAILLKNYGVQHFQNELYFYQYLKIKRIFILFSLNAISNIIAFYFFFKAIQYTLLSHAYILFTMVGPFIVLIRLCLCKYVNKEEIKGTIVIFLGAIIVNLDHNSTKVGQIKSTILYGNLLALFSGMFSVVTVLSIKYISISIENKRQIVLNQMIFLNVFTVIICVIPYFFPNLGIDLPKFDFSDQGMFGWLTPQHFLYCFFVIGCTIRIGNFITYAIAFEYFSSVVVSNIFMLEPIVGQIAGILMQIDHIPKIPTYIGAIIIIFGIYYLSVNMEKEKTNY